MEKEKIYVIIYSIMIFTTILPMVNSEDENYEGHQSINNYISTEYVDNSLEEIDATYYVMSERITQLDANNASPKPIPLNTPDYFNWKDYEDKDWMTPAKDQGLCGSCWAFAALGVLESIINIREGSADLDPDLSEQYLLSCLPRTGSCNGGLVYYTYYYINDTTFEGNYCNGIIFESCFPYQADDTVPCSEKCVDWEEKLVPISDFGYFITDGSINDREVIQTQIMQNGPISTSIEADDDFIQWGIDSHNSNDYYPYYERDITNHAIIILGWKEDPSIGKGGYWICKNSWGTDWGYDGFFNIEYDSQNIANANTTIVWVDYDPASVDWPPIVPSIDGPTKGSPGEEYEYIISSRDPDGNDDIYYYIDWGDGQVEEWIGSYNSDEELLIKHIWNEKETYILKVKAKDIHDAESDWATLEISMPKNKPYINSPFLQFLENHPHLFPLLRQLLGLK